jgi:hypothetical protein
LDNNGFITKARPYAYESAKKYYPVYNEPKFNAYIPPFKQEKSKPQFDYFMPKVETFGFKQRSGCPECGYMTGHASYCSKQPFHI